MQIELSAEDQAFKEEVQQFLTEKLPKDISNKVKRGYGISKDELNEWTRILNDRGWAAPNWPVENGGTGWSMVRRHLFDIECRQAQAPQLSGFGFNMVGPAIIAYGTEEQKARYLPEILRSEVWWCQGYSEPQAGSDLATVRTTARRDGDDYVINGSKIWTSGAELADRIFLLARTDPDSKPQLGISFLLMDMDLPGVTVEPLLAFNGKRLWNQVFFDDVRIPCTQILGKENQGWTVAKNLLGNERLLVSRVAENRRLLMRNIEIIEAETQRGVILEAGLTTRLSELKIRLDALDSTALRLLTRFDAGGSIGAEPSMLKLQGSQLVQEMDRIAYDLVGYLGLAMDSSNRQGDPIGPEHSDMVASGMFHHRGFTIAGGTSEIQHNIIAKLVLGL